MSDQDSKATVGRLLEEVWNAGNLTFADEVVAPNFVRHGPTAEGAVRGRDGLKRLVAMYRAAYPDLHVAVEEQMTEGGTVVTRWTASGMHRGTLMGIAPTGKTVTVAGVIIDRLADGKIETEWAFYDVMGMLQQLGVTKM